MVGTEETLTSAVRRTAVFVYEAHYAYEYFVLMDAELVAFSFFFLPIVYSPLHHCFSVEI